MARSMFLIYFGCLYVAPVIIEEQGNKSIVPIESEDILPKGLILNPVRVETKSDLSAECLEKQTNRDLSSKTARKLDVDHYEPSTNLADILRRKFQKYDKSEEDFKKK